jgi:ABC-type histidine transport system ATPase subunit
MLGIVSFRVFPEFDSFSHKSDFPNHLTGFLEVIEKILDSNVEKANIFIKKVVIVYKEMNF